MVRSDLNIRVGFRGSDPDTFLLSRRFDPVFFPERSVPSKSTLIRNPEEVFLKLPLRIVLSVVCIVLKEDGNSEIGAHVRNYFCTLI